MGRGPDACEKESNAAREACLRECPRATAVPSCEDKCRQRAEAVFKACIDAGRSEEACHKESADAKLACLKECPRPDATATPKPIERSCTERCAAHAEEIYKTCIAAGRGADACQNESRQAKEACLKDCPRDATKTPGPPDRTCEQRCAAAAEEGYKACIAAGRGPDVCEAEAKVAREKCVGACPKPEPTRIGNCEEKCKKRFDEVYNACIASGRGPDDCEAEAHKAKEACLLACPRPEGTKTPQSLSCEGRCKEHAAAELTTVKDPVCGMSVTLGAGKPSLEHDGEMVHFCSQKCHVFLSCSKLGLPAPRATDMPHTGSFTVVTSAAACSQWEPCDPCAL